MNAAIVAERKGAMTFPYLDLAGIWLLCGLLAAGFYNGHIREQTKPRSKKRFLQIFLFSTALGALAGPLALAGCAGSYLKSKAWPVWTLSWKPPP